MIEFMKGKVYIVELDHVVIESNHGLGYRVSMVNPMVLTEGEETFLHTHQVIKEDSHTLYGFVQKEERDLFRILLEVSGVGPKAGMAILSGGAPVQIVRAILTEDLRFLTKLPGIGKKTAQRMILDLKEKLDKLNWVSLLQTETEAPTSNPVPQVNETDRSRDVVDALMGLGYNEEEAKRAVEKVASEANETLTTEDWIRRALQATLTR
ncbi:Holliday junction branch migration protein RuvA [Risungbinella massiliensis]|uniref:Holliday junction branch migration protein RuvA n=1 Tax=Risungbinella massiliensis TaxID=1329796 RepID=UPI0005CC3346|nr:Holliday junction branch migration protein RuvA [Risungbinella massiliensis]